ncbi:MAG: glycoside hydrolase family 9 protein [Victivallales bacterium]|nr:glycoside hydrolase family 9 protein [Victivallales bacterium]
MSLKPFWITLLASILAYAGANLVPNPSFQQDAKGDIVDWVNTKDLKQHLSVKDGALHIVLPAFKQFKFDSKIIELNQTEPVPLRYSLHFKGETFPYDWHHGLLLDKLEYMDGTTEGWGKSHFIFRSRSRTWSEETFTLIPPKPIKSFRVSFLFTSAQPADFWIKELSITEMPDAFNTPDWEENFGPHPTNLVPNPGFETVKNGDVKNWVKFTELHPLNAGLKNNVDMTLDKTTPRSGNYSLKLSNSKDSLGGAGSTILSVIDPTREYTFSAYVKAENATGNTYIEVLFYSQWAPMGIGSNAGDFINRVPSRIDLVGAYQSPMTSGTHEWKQLSVTMQPPPSATHVCFKLHTNDNTGSVWFDDLMFDGFGNAAIEPIISQLGYQRKGVKKAFVRSTLPDKQGRFILLNEKGKKCASGKLNYRGLDEWGHQEFEADFSSISQCGIYQLVFNIGEKECKTREFQIREDLYTDLLEKSRSFMYHSRCGFDIPGFHPACHLDDGQLRSKPNLLAGGKIIGHHDSSGGWHDAGDFDKFPCAAAPVITYLARAGAYLSSEALLDEAKWGADWLCKLATPTGMYYKIERLSPNGSIVIDLCRPESETDNIPGNEDDRVVTGPGHDIICSWAILEYALTEKSPERQKQYMDVAMMLYNDFITCQPKMETAKRHQYFAAILALDNFAMFRLTKQQEYFDKGVAFFTQMLDIVEPRLNEKRFKEWKEEHVFPLGWAIASLEFTMQYPDAPISERCRQMVKKLLDEYVLPAQISYSYGNIDFRKWLLPGGHGHASITQLANASLMARAAVVFKNRAYLDQAELSFMYTTGLNPMGASLVAGCGYKTVATWIALEPVPGCNNGTVLTGGVQKGVRRASGRKNIPPSYLANEHSDYCTDNPPNFPCMVLAGSKPLGPTFCVQESWEAINGVQIHAIEAILEAAKRLY